MDAIIIIAVIVAVIIGIVAVVRHKIRKFSRAAFGTDSIIDVINSAKQNQEQMRSTPRSLHGMTSVYLPQIKRDFPEFDYELYKNKAQSLLRSYFTAICTKKVSALAGEYTLAFENGVRGIVEDLNSRDVSQMYCNIVLHDVQIARYIKNGATVTVLFEVAVEYYSYIVDADGKVVFGSKDNKMQTVYEVELVYVQDADKMGVHGDALGINCPNCGAPIKNLGEKFCEYCGTAVKEINIRAWKFNAVREQTLQQRQF